MKVLRILSVFLIVALIGILSHCKLFCFKNELILCLMLIFYLDVEAQMRQFGGANIQEFLLCSTYTFIK